MKVCFLFSIRPRERIFEGVVHQKTCFECFLEVLVSRNVSAVFVLVGVSVAGLNIEYRNTLQ